MKKAALLLVAVVVLVLALSSVALAATPQDIYNDYLDNSKLDGNYTDAELRAYLADATVHMYGNPTVVDGLDMAVNELLSREEFPFTGAQIAIIVAVVVVLIGGGIGLRLFARRSRTKA